MSEEINFIHAAPQFRVRDVEKAVNFYKDILGFGLNYSNGSPWQYAVVCRGNVYIHLNQTLLDKETISRGCTYIVVDNIDCLWNLLKDYEGILENVDIKHHGSDVIFKEFVLRDPDGNIIRFGEEVKNPQE